ncbi:hypothetical protein TNCV_1375811 [Trichonephila clavipes]|nr:hypothetical protein TNCV_1375811 [Trichonephila clavipes]
MFTASELWRQCRLIRWVLGVPTPKTDRRSAPRARNELKPALHGAVEPKSSREVSRRGRKVEAPDHSQGVLQNWMESS